MDTQTTIDPETGATYHHLPSAPVARTIHVSDVVLVDVDDSGTPVGVEYVVATEHLDPSELNGLIRAFPRLRGLVT